MRLVKNKFVDWLKSKDPKEIVGKTRDGLDCPLMRFYYSETREEHFIFEDMNNGGYAIDRGYSRRPLPDWASRFALWVDHDCEGDDVLAGRALEVALKL